MKELEKEILVIQNIIRLLNECLSIALATKNKVSEKECIRDIQLCKKELAKLIAAKERENGAKEPAGDAAI